jgi:hypothetical protein
MGEKQDVIKEELRQANLHFEQLKRDLSAVVIVEATRMLSAP